MTDPPIVEKAREKEVRFALVLYGGVSLAIYMNGVTQEFLHLVRATSDSSRETSEIEAVYRELASLTRSRFVVDIASGSSAGGINAIFLGKALANGQPLECLSRLWLDVASLDRLWNTAVFPRSLLSGHEMYIQMLSALEDMDKNAMDASRCPGGLQPEMDVFITATDIQGLELPMQLTDMAIVEKLHKNVFHLKFGSSENDFTPLMNPFLAFTGRATSSFPAAFEPMKLEDSTAANAAKFFPAYTSAGADYSRRAFGDGGYLNNKPFNHALHEIPHRQTDLPVRRLLMYIEPTPERASGNCTEAAPGAIRNSIEALITLHQYETIREDLREVLDRNRLIGRVREITSMVDHDVETWREAGNPAMPRLDGASYGRRTLADEIHARGPGYAGYHRLKVRAVTDDLAEIIGASQSAMDGWRTRTYSEQNSSQSESQFLLHFDLGYRQRRVRFLIAKLDEVDGSSTVAGLRRELNQIARSLADLSLLVKRLRFDATQIDSAAVFLREAFERVTIPASSRLEECLAGHPLKQAFDQYEDYDQVTFPIFYETEVGGEAEPVEVFRVSPLDARSLIDELSPSERRRKLAGTALFHFGAFAKREWRENDMLWGRLDGAERIVSAVLPSESPDAVRLIRAAHLAILREQFGAQTEGVYQQLKTTYEVDRRIGIFRALRLIAHLAFVSVRMSIASKCASHRAASVNERY